MEINEFRQNNRIQVFEETAPLVEVHDACELPAGALYPKSVQKFAYRGYAICTSLVSGNWWITNSQGNWCGMAASREGAIGIVDDFCKDSR